MRVILRGVFNTIGGGEIYYMIFSAETSIFLSFFFCSLASGIKSVPFSRSHTMCPLSDYRFRIIITVCFDQPKRTTSTSPGSVRQRILSRSFSKVSLNSVMTHYSANFSYTFRTFSFIPHTYNDTASTSDCSVTLIRNQWSNISSFPAFFIPYIFLCKYYTLWTLVALW